jgi:hypothetical protein
MKIVRIKKTFRKYRSFWYNGMAGAIFFVTDLNKDEYRVHAINPITNESAYWPKHPGIESIHKTHTGAMILKHHAEVIGKIPQNH